MAEIVIVRHAEPTLRGVFLGSTDVGLSAVGREQATRLTLPPGLPIYVSPMRRAIETAEAAGLIYQVLSDLREIDYGPWEGLRWAEIEERFPREAEQKMNDWMGYCVPGAEAWSAFESRVHRAIESIGRPCVIVAHQAVNAVVRERVTGEPALGFVQDYCEIVKL